MAVASAFRLARAGVSWRRANGAGWARHMAVYAASTDRWYYQEAEAAPPPPRTNGHAGPVSVLDIALALAAGVADIPVWGEQAADDQPGA